MPDDDWAVLPLSWGGSLRFAAPGAGALPSGCRLWVSSLALLGELVL